MVASGCSDCKEVRTYVNIPSTHFQSQERGGEVNTEDSNALLHANHSPLRGFLAPVGTALERAEIEFSNAVSTGAWKPHRGHTAASDWRSRVSWNLQDLCEDTLGIECALPLLGRP